MADLTELLSKLEAAGVRVWQDGPWTIVHTEAAGAKTTISLTQEQADHLAFALIELSVDDRKPTEADLSAARERALLILELERLRPYSAAATKGEWEVEQVHNEGAYGSGPGAVHGFSSYQMLGDGDVLFDTLNSTAALVDEEYDESTCYAHDSVGAANLQFVAKAVAYVRRALSRSPASETKP